jgi:hypothetical protein
VPVAEHIIQRDLATRLRLDVRQIRRLEDAGMPTRVRSGKKDYPWPESLHWYLDYKVEAEVARRMPSTKTDLENRELQLKVRLSELKVAEAEAKVFPAQVVRRRLELVHQQTAAAMRALPQYAAEFVGLQSLAEARLRCERIANELLARARGDDDQDEGDPDDPEEKLAA